MKSKHRRRSLCAFVCILITHIVLAQAPAVPKWSTNGNTLGAGSNRLGSLDNVGVKIITNNATRIYVDSTTGNVGINTTTPTDRLYVKGNQVLAGNLSFTTGSQFIQFGLPNGSATPMMYMFPGGTNNLTRMVIAHSPSFISYGLRYTDATDEWDFIANGVSAFNIGSITGNAKASNNFTAKSLKVTDSAMIAKRLGVGGPTASNYVINVNASAALNGINITDAVDNYGIYCSKSGSNQGIYVLKSSTLSNTPCIEGQSSGTSDGAWGISSSGAGVFGKSTSGSGVIGYTSNSSAWGGYFTGNVYTSGMYQTSDARTKKNIKSLDNAMDIIDQLQPKTYEFRDDGDYAKLNLPKGDHYGLLAQDVEKIIPGIVKDASISTNYLSAAEVKEGDGGKKIEFKAVNYSELIPVLVKGMQEQQKTIAELRDEIAALKDLIESKGIASASETNAVGNSVNGMLEQNSPNPFSAVTTIRYNVPGGSTASLQIISNKGAVVKTYATVKGKGQVIVNRNELAVGTYTYRLIVDGKVADSKQMVLTR